MIINIYTYILEIGLFAGQGIFSKKIITSVFTIIIYHNLVFEKLNWIEKINKLVLDIQTKLSSQKFLIRECLLNWTNNIMILPECIY